MARTYILAIALGSLPMVSNTSAQEVAFESAAQLPVWANPKPHPQDDALRLSMHANVERRSRIFYLGLAASALYSPDGLSYLSDNFELRPQIGFRFRSATHGATDFVAERIAIVGPLLFGEIGLRASWKLSELTGLYARAAFRGGFDVTRIEPENLGRSDVEDSQVVSASVLFAHGGVGAHLGPFQLGVEFEVFGVPSQSKLGQYEEILDGTVTFPLFAFLRLSRQVYFYFRAIPFHPFSRLPYTWGIAGVLSPHVL